jgi:hypothetical protein
MALVDQSVQRRHTGSALVALLKNRRLGYFVGLMGKLIGLGLFATIVYTYCNVLIESCIRGIH